MQIYTFIGLWQTYLRTKRGREETEHLLPPKPHSYPPSPPPLPPPRGRSIILAYLTRQGRDTFLTAPEPLPNLPQGGGDVNAAHCIGQRMRLHRPTQRTAIANAAHCVLCLITLGLRQQNFQPGHPKQCDGHKNTQPPTRGDWVKGLSYLCHQPKDYTPSTRGGLGVGAFAPPSLLHWPWVKGLSCLCQQSKDYTPSPRGGLGVGASWLGVGASWLGVGASWLGVGALYLHILRRHSR